MEKYDGSVFILVDALGWEIHRRVNFLKDCHFEAKRLRSVFGYSSTCYPSIFTGRDPQVHGLWNSYFYTTNPISPDWIRFCRYLPKFIRNSWKVRTLISRYLKSRIKHDGYFALYRVPYEYLCYFGYAEEEDLLKPGGISRCESIFDIVHAKGLRRCVPHYDTPDQEKLDRIVESMQKDVPPPQFTFIALGGLDGWLHKYGPVGKVVDDYIAKLENKVRVAVDQARKTYKNPYICIFSDHGQAGIHKTADIWSRIKELGLEFGKDYIAFYDATMARFWYLNDGARQKINAKLDSTEFKALGRRVSHDELKREGCYFDDFKYGEEIFLVPEGTEIIPSFMSDAPVAGMHGYHPDDPASWATLLCNSPIPEEITSIKDIFKLMKFAIDNTI